VHLRLREMRRISIGLLTAGLVIVSLFIVRVGTPFAYFGWTGIGPAYTGSGLRVAIVKPVFTATAYAGFFDGSPSFYEFYGKHGKDPRTEIITTDLNLLNVSVVDGWGWSKGLERYVTSVLGDYSLGLIAARSFTIISDINVTEGGLFNADASSKFDVVILGFTEYVTLQEYNDFQRFVGSGGRLVMMDASSFVAEVRYYPHTNHLALVRGHGWGFDGTKAWSDIFYRWQDENANGVGSNQCCSGQNKYAGASVTGDYPISIALRERFGPVVFGSYTGHEENGITNNTDTTILATWFGPGLSPQNAVAAYLHRYVNGTVVDIGVVSSDVVDRDVSVQFFLLSSIVDSTRTQIGTAQ